VRALLSDPRSRDHLIAISAFSAAEVDLLSQIDPDKIYPLARTDVGLGEDGRVIITEINVTSRLGLLMEFDVMTQALAGCPWFDAAVREHHLTTGTVLGPLGRMLHQLGHTPGTSRICVCEGSPLPGSGRHFLVDLAAEQFRRLNYPVVVAALDDLACMDGRIVHQDTGAIDLVYRMFDHRDVPTDDVYRHLTGDGRQVVLIDDVASEILVSKLVLTMLTEQRWLDRIGGSIADRLGRVLPWTRLLADRKTEAGGRTVDLVEFTVKNRETLVLKPGRGARGMWIIIGCEETQEQWEKAVATALRSKIPWVVQEFLDPHTVTAVFADEVGQTTSAEQIANYGALLINGTCEAMIRREGRAGHRVLNTIEGARALPVYQASGVGR
jgi:hypothetical protein